MPLTTLDISAPQRIAIATYPAGAAFGPRRMQDWEFVWLIEGDARYRSDQQWADAPRNSIVLCRPGTTDFFEWDRRRRTRHGFFHFTIESTPAHWPPPEAWPLVRVPEGDDILRPLFRHMLTWAGQGDAEQERLALAHLLTAFVTGQLSAADVPPAHLPDAIEQALALISRTLEEDPAAALTLPQLAAAAFVTPEHLCRVFGSTLGCTPMEAVRLTRLDHGMALLARSNYSISEIAALCGFSSPYHFSLRFKKAFDMPPREMRRAIQNGLTPPLPLMLGVLRR